mgnify:CR=1 FL=1
MINYLISWISDGYVSNQVRYAWANSIDPIQLFPIALPDFIIKEAYVTSRLESYSTGLFKYIYQRISDSNIYV